MKAGERGALASYWLEKAERSLDTARLLYEQGDLDFCANRLYPSEMTAEKAVTRLAETLDFPGAEGGSRTRTSAEDTRF